MAAGIKYGSVPDVGEALSTYLSRATAVPGGMGVGGRRKKENRLRIRKPGAIIKVK